MMHDLLRRSLEDYVLEADEEGLFLPEWSAHSMLEAINNTSLSIERKLPIPVLTLDQKVGLVIG